MAQFRKRSGGHAIAHKLRGIAGRIEARADDPAAVAAELRDLTHYARAAQARHQEGTMTSRIVRKIAPQGYLYDVIAGADLSADLTEERARRVVDRLGAAWVDALGRLMARADEPGRIEESVA